MSLKVAIVVGTFPTVSETFILNQIVALINDGHQVHIFANEKGNLQILHNTIIEYKLLDKVIYRRKQPFKKNKRILFFLKWLFLNFKKIDWLLLFRALNFFHYGKKALSLKVFFENEWFLLKENFDVIHIHFATNAKSLIKLKKNKSSKNFKIVVSFHGYDINPFYIENYKKDYKKLFENVDEITVNSIYTKDLLLKINSDLKNINILPVGLDTSFFKKEDVDQSTINKTILYVGRLIPLKGSNLTIDILYELHKRGYQNVKLIIIGDGELKIALQEKIENLRLENYILLKGSLSQEKVKEEMNCASLLLLPGIHDPLTKRAETQGLVIQEAESMELPVVVSNVGGMKYGLLPNVSGFVVDESDVNGFADAIEKLLNNDELQRKMGERGRKFVVKKYDSKILIKQLISIYQKKYN